MLAWVRFRLFFLISLAKSVEKAMTTHSSIPAWKIQWTEEPGRLRSMGSLRIGRYWATSLSFFTFMHWRRKWQPTLVFLPGESQGWGSLVGCHLWGHTELDTTEATYQQQQQQPNQKRPQGSKKNLISDFGHRVFPPTYML